VIAGETQGAEGGRGRRVGLRPDSAGGHGLTHGRNPFASSGPCAVPPARPLN
jgi:hypothetical protein